MVGISQLKRQTGLRKRSLNILRNERAVFRRHGFEIFVGKNGIGSEIGKFLFVYDVGEHGVVI